MVTAVTAMGDHYFERTASGHEVRVYSGGDDEAKLTFEGVQLYREAGSTTVTMTIGEAREIFQALGEALSWYGVEQALGELRAHLGAHLVDEGMVRA